MTKDSMDLLELLRKRGVDGEVDFLREALQVLVEGIMDAEVSAQIGAQLSERSPDRLTHRNGLAAVMVRALVSYLVPCLHAVAEQDVVIVIADCLVHPGLGWPSLGRRAEQQQRGRCDGCNSQDHENGDSALRS